jgi:hypothetical protein
MDSLSNIISKVLNEYVKLPTSPGMTRHLMVNAAQSEFWLSKMGWQDHTRIHSTTAHLEIKNNLIWIHRDETEDGIASDLEQNGIPKEQIVLAFHPVYKRPLTGFATGES